MTATAAKGLAREEAVARLRAAFSGTLAAVRRLRGRDTHRPDELGFAQYHLLFGLADQSELTTGELALTADLAPATVTQMLDGLAALGLVERTRSDRDRRVIICKLTHRGRDLIAERRAYFEQRWHDALAGFSARDLAVAAAVMERLRDLYDEFATGGHEQPA